MDMYDHNPAKPVEVETASLFDTSAIDSPISIWGPYTKNPVKNINEYSFFIRTTSFTIFELMEYLGFNKRVIVIDYNGTILEKSLWKEIILQNKDCLEILSIAGGG